MSWFWGSSKSNTKTATNPREALADSKFDDQAVPDSALPQATKAPLSRDEQAALEFNELLKEFQEQSETEKGARVQARESGNSFDSAPTNIHPDSVYPTEMSCRSALDYAMFCQSLGGQFVNVYRYGQFRSCSNHWQDFWLCMRTRNFEEKDRIKAVQDHYKQKAVKWKQGPSSEDIWTVRTEPVKDAFQDNLEELEARIAQWKAANPDVQDQWSKQQGATFKDAVPPSS